MSQSDKRELILFLVKCLLFYGIGAIVNNTWVTLERIFYGGPQPSMADTFIWIALTVSLYCNLRHHVKFGKEGAYAESRDLD